MLLNNKGMTLVEVMIALLVLLLVSLALMQTALLSIDSNMINLIRDEAVSIADETMNEARNTLFDNLAAGTTTNTVRRQFRNIKDPANPALDYPFTVSRIVTVLNTDNKRIDITVTWEWKERTVANNNAYTHAISTILRRQ